MATAQRDIPLEAPEGLRPLEDVRVGIVTAEWNKDITAGLLKGALSVLEPLLPTESIIQYEVPGSFELPLGAQWLFEHCDVDAVICIGSVIRGETAHFDFVCQGCTQGIMEVGLRFSRPCMFCVLTDDHKEQSLARSGGHLGNKGTEAAIGAWRLLMLKESIS